ncbi:angiogenic factor with G patch and FHA domains 1 [Caerostris darwini]|uniref:Angiogenic factor with G patch and FHA domains 1 n=1 Tax=Caerostris darwini TaxID=1538125 RepID=A0AAV4QZB2_9ARAC|nr:angiogenic factor with G patch and FHA domains 1 [Caerostris darwini]
MSDSDLKCDGCKVLHTLIKEKDKEIKELNLQIQHLTELLHSHDIVDKQCRSCYYSADKITNDDESPNKIVSSHELENVNGNSPFHYQKQNYNPLIESPAVYIAALSDVENSSTGFPSPNRTVGDGNIYSSCKNVHENVDPCKDYIYDETSKMYYSQSTGYYYDANTQLFYVPQTGSYYKYNHSKRIYEQVEDSKQTSESKVADSCDKILEKDNNFQENEKLPVIKVDHYITRDENSSCPSDYTININIRSSLNPAGNTENQTINDSSKDWQPPEGSNATVKDLVTEVAEKSCGMSDYIYDEKSAMYYCKSNGNYYDPIRKLLYDPRLKVYYLYIQEKLAYEFYCRADEISDISDKNICSDNKTDLKEKSERSKRKKFWKEKQKKLGEESKVMSPSNNDDIRVDNDSTVNDGYSSPEAGEIFSSDSEHEIIVEYQSSPKKESPPRYQPCIRAIVEDSSALTTGSLILITCTGALIGRENCNTVSVPDIDVSKVHAEIKFDNKSWKYSIEDLGSQNGTFVNEVRLSEPKQKSKPHELNHGDKLSLGSCKLLLHIHGGLETCDKCEPGQVIAELSKEGKSAHVIKTKKQIEKERRKELRKIKKKYGLKGMEYCDANVSHVDSKYEDKAEFRRKTVGSENPYEKTEMASMDVHVPQNNKGYQLLKKLGWKEGDSLGVANSGISDPVSIQPWVSKAGLGCTHAETSCSSTPTDKRKKKWVKAQERYFRLTT